jgi:hypothetical protein
MQYLQCQNHVASNQLITAGSTVTRYMEVLVYRAGFCFRGTTPSHERAATGLALCNAVVGVTEAEASYAGGGFLYPPDDLQAR